MKGNKKKKKMKQAKKVKEPDKPSKRVTMVSKYTKNDDDKDENFFDKQQMDKVSRMAPEASDENFFELRNSPSEKDVDCNERKLHENNITDNIDIQEIIERIETDFQEKFKEKWDKNLEEEKILRKLASKHPTRSFSYLRSVSGKEILMYIKGKEESVKSGIYLEMLTEVNKLTTETLEQLTLLKDKVGSANSEEEFKVVKAEMEEEIDKVKCQEIMEQLIRTKIDEHLQNAKEWELMVETHRK